MTQRDKAIYLDIDVKTLRNWRKHKPNLYKIVMLSFAFEDAEKKWTMPIQNWSLTISQLNIHFKERLKNALNLV